MHGHAAAVMPTAAGVALAGYSGSKALFIGTDKSGDIPGVSWAASVSASSVPVALSMRTVSVTKERYYRIGDAVAHAIKSGQVHSHCLLRRISSSRYDAYSDNPVHCGQGSFFRRDGERGTSPEA
jgi:hypothetical protein